MGGVGGGIEALGFWVLVLHDFGCLGLWALSFRVLAMGVGALRLSGLGVCDFGVCRAAFRVAVRTLQHNPLERAPSP